MLRTFARSRGGNFSMMLALMLVPIVGGAQLAIDVSRLVNARSSLQSATDAALLAASHLKDSDTDRKAVFQKFLRANLAGNSDLESFEGKIDVSPAVNSIRTTATVTGVVKLSLVPFLGTPRTITITSGAYEATNSLEVAMVLDNTGSMGASRMQALREAAQSLTDILKTVESPARSVKVALVPFVAAVNVNGEGYKESWIDTEGRAPYNGANFVKRSDGTPYSHLELFDELEVEWKGCVEARPAPYNLADVAPDASNPSTLFVPYFAPDNPGPAHMSPNDGNIWNNSYLSDDLGSSPNGAQKSVERYLDGTVARYIRQDGSRTTGPNYACPTPIQPLTDKFDTISDAIKQMIYWEGGGTNVAEGLAWGMRVLSPQEPYAQGASFDDKTVSKVVVVFTDGENTVFGAKNETENTSDYGAYSFLDSGRFGTTNRNKALTQVNTWTRTMCTKLKEKDVKVFAVLLGADTPANRELYSECASQPSYYFPAKDVSGLQGAFTKIGAAVAQLYLTN